MTSGRIATFIFTVLIILPQVRAENCCTPEKSLTQQITTLNAEVKLSSCELVKIKKDEIVKNNHAKFNFVDSNPYADFNRAYAEFSKTLNSCQHEALEKCHPNLKETISEAELNKLFSKWQKNPIYHMRDPAVHCYSRAYLLSKELTELGYKTHLMQIEESPTLIAMMKNEKGKRIYTDYSGHHWVVQIETSEPVRKLVLDPQFMQKPVTPEEYFKKTTGQICKEGPASKMTADCNFNILSNNHLQNPDYKDDQLSLASHCGWPLSPSFKKEITKLNAHQTETLKPVNLDGTDEVITQKLIKTAWLNKRNELKSEIERLKLYNTNLKKNIGRPVNLGVQITEKDIITSVKEIEFAQKDLKYFEQKMKELGITND